jgi:hypothetical protein
MTEVGSPATHVQREVFHACRNGANSFLWDTLDDLGTFGPLHWAG